MLLTHVDWVGDCDVVGDAIFPELGIPRLCCKLVVKGGQAWGFECGAVADADVQDSAGRGCEAAQRVACSINQTRSHTCYNVSVSSL